MFRMKVQRCECHRWFTGRTISPKLGRTNSGYWICFWLVASKIQSHFFREIWVSCVRILYSIIYSKPVGNETKSNKPSNNPKYIYNEQREFWSRRIHSKSQANMKYMKYVYYPHSVYHLQYISSMIVWANFLFGNNIVLIPIYTHIYPSTSVEDYDFECFIIAAIDNPEYDIFWI